jgi:membrane protein implicated in regulation of membrane protease activity
MDTIIWLVLLVVFAAAEAVTVGLVSLWFALGALVALLLSLVVDSIWAEVWVCLLVSVVALLLLRPWVNRYFSPKDHKATNTDLLMGQEALVTEAIDNLSAVGQVKVKGQIWSARSADGAPIAAGTVVTVLRLEGVKLYVQPKVAE